MLVSFIILTYNQEKYIKESLISVLEQDYEHIEFIISDDCSTDNTVLIIKEVLYLYQNIKVKLNVNQENLGLTGNLNSAIELTSGEIIALAAGDDVSCKNRIKRSVDIFKENPGVSFLSFNDMKIDEQGREIGFVYSLENDITVSFAEYINSVDTYFSGASRSFRRTVYDTFGSINKKCPTEDSPYILRCLYMGLGYIYSTPGIKYRIHNSNLSSISSISRMDHSEIEKQYLGDLNTAINLNLISSFDKRNALNWIKFMRYKKRLAMCLGLFERLLVTISYFHNPLVIKFVMRKLKVGNE